jgi:hypothetical protein
MIGGDSSKKDQYGIELILDLHGCDAAKFTRPSITEYFEELCVLIDMQREDLHFWDDVGLSDQLQAVYINIFSCKVYDPKVAEKFSVEWFGATDCSARFIDRV